MDYQGKAESGLHLLARLSSRPSLVGLDNTLFPDGPRPKEVIDIVGNLASGKTLLLTQFLAKCLLPPKWQELEIGGLGVGAIIIDTDHHFHIVKLVNLMENQLRKLKSTSHPSTSLLNSKAIEAIIKEALTRLFILNCFDSSQLFATFHSLPRILSANTNISFILIDSISAFYWQDVVMGGVRKMDMYVKKVILSLQKCVQEYKVSIAYTRPSYFQSKVKNVRDDIATYQINLQKKEFKGHDALIVEVNTSRNKFSYHYQINEDGLQWLTGNEIT